MSARQTAVALLLVSALFLMPFPRSLVSESLVRAFYEPAVRASGLLLAVAELQRENARLARENAALAARAAGALLSTGGVRVLSLSTPPPARMTLGVGSSAGVTYGTAVVSSSGALVGRVVAVRKSSSSVSTVFDQATQVGVVDTRSEVIGVYRGNCDLRFVPVWADVAVGDTVVTSDIGGTYPAGIPVGVVTSVVSSPDEVFYRIRVRPFYDYSRRTAFSLVR